MKTSLTRKEYRKRQQQFTFYGHIKKNAAVVGTTVTACSIVAPVVPLHSVHADEVDSNASSSYNRAADSNAENMTATAQSNETVTESSTQSATQESKTQETATQETVTQESKTQETATQESTMQDSATEQTEGSGNSVDSGTTTDSSTVDSSRVEDQTSVGPQAEVSTFSRSTGTVSTTAFINKIGGLAQSVAAAHGLYASVMVAQAILESSWGNSTLSQTPNNNLFGIKGSYLGSSVNMATSEYLNGRWVTIRDAFRKYPSYRESLQDNAALLSTNLYRGAWKANTSSYKGATSALTGLYATAPNYNSVLNSLIEMYGLTRFDTAGSGSNVSHTSTAASKNNGSSGSSGHSNSSSSQATYKVKSGDSVWAVANQYGITMDQLRSWNNIKNNFIYPGQKLRVRQTGQSSSTVNNSSATSSSSKPTSSSSSKSGAYTVKSGDSVWAISNKYGVTMDQLRSWNNIKNNFIYPGQQLKVKQRSQTSSASNSTAAKPATSSSSSKQKNSKTAAYKVKSGDSVWAISNKYGITMDQLRSWNNIKNDFVYPGQSLKVKPTAPTKVAQSSRTKTTNKSHYQVKSGDSLWLIAQQYKVSIDHIKKINQLSSDTIYVGQSLKVS